MIIMPSAPASTDNYALFDHAFTGFTDTTGKTVVSSSITGGEATLVLLALGQSLTTNATPTPFTPTSPKVHNLNIYDGITYRAVDPLLGTAGTGGNYLSRLGDKLISDGSFARVILVPAAIGGTYIHDWIPSGLFDHRARVALKRIRAQGWVGNADVTFRVLWEQGQGDTAAGIGTLQAIWQARFQQIVGTINGFGLGTPQITVPKDTMVANVIDATIRAAQAAVVDNVQVFAGPDFDTLTGVTNRSDGTHPSDTGADNFASLIQPYF